MKRNNNNTILTVIVAVAAHSFISQVQAELLGYWPINDGDGMTVTNEVGDPSLNATLDSGAMWTAAGGGHTGRPGDYALELNGTANGTARLSGLANVLESVTITAWLKLDATPPAWAGIFESRSGGANQIGFGFHNATGNLMYIWNNNNANSWGWDSTVHVDNDVWTFVAMVLTPDDVTFYAGPRGGNLMSNTNVIANIAQSGGDWTMGIDACCGGSRNIDGQIDDIAIWDEALTSDEIELLWSEAVTPLTVFGAGPLFQFTSIQPNLDSSEVTVTWSTLPTRTYSIDFSDDLTAWIELDDSLPSDGEETSYTQTAVGATRRYYRVRQD